MLRHYCCLEQAATVAAGSENRKELWPQSAASNDSSIVTGRQAAHIRDSASETPSAFTRAKSSPLLGTGNRAEDDVGRLSHFRLVLLPHVASGTGIDSYRRALLRPTPLSACHHPRRRTGSLGDWRGNVCPLRQHTENGTVWFASAAETVPRWLP